ncbi:MAG: hypothetical protein ABI220_03825 [Candidatus Saccharimonadales bacterium]
MFASTNLADSLNLAIGTASIIFGIVALLLSVVFFFEAKKAEKNSAVTLEGISKTTVTLDRLSMRIINKLTSAIIEPSQREETLRALLMTTNASGGLSSSVLEPSTGSTKAELEQFRVDNLITAYYYCALANISARFNLPVDIAESSSHEAVTRIVDGSASDFGIIQNWLRNTDGIQDKIIHSPVKPLYDMTLPMIDDVFNTLDHYARRERESIAKSQS